MTEEPNHYIRLAGRQELDAVAGLVREAFAPFEEVLPRHIFEPYLKESSDFSERLADTDVAVLLRGDRLVGTVSYYSDAAREGMGWASGLAGLRTLPLRPPPRATEPAVHCVSGVLRGPVTREHPRSCCTPPAS